MCNGGQKFFCQQRWGHKIFCRLRDFSSPPCPRVIFSTSVPTIFYVCSGQLFFYTCHKKLIFCIGWQSKFSMFVNHTLFFPFLGIARIAIILCMFIKVFSMSVQHSKTKEKEKEFVVPQAAHVEYIVPSARKKRPPFSPQDKFLCSRCTKETVSERGE